MEIKKINLSGTSQRLNAEIEFDNDTGISQVWKLNTFACESDMAIDFLNKSDDPDVVMDFLESRGEQIEGERIVSDVAVENFFKDIKNMYLRWKNSDVKLKDAKGSTHDMMKSTILKSGWIERNVKFPLKATYQRGSYVGDYNSLESLLATVEKNYKEAVDEHLKWAKAYGPRGKAIDEAMGLFLSWIYSTKSLDDVRVALDVKLDEAMAIISKSKDPLKEFDRKKAIAFTKLTTSQSWNAREVIGFDIQDKETLITIGTKLAEYGDKCDVVYESSNLVGYFADNYSDIFDGLAYHFPALKQKIFDFMCMIDYSTIRSNGPNPSVKDSFRPLAETVTGLL